MTFNYSKLRGKIKEICKTENEFAEAMGMGRATLSFKLNGKSEFTSDEMSRCMCILGIDKSEVGEYFFNKNS